MAFARGSCVLMILAAGLAAALCLGGITLPVNLMDTSTIAHAIAVVATSAVAILATAAGTLVVSDWQGDVQSRQEWARLGLAPAHLSRAVELERENDLAPRYLAPTSDEALRQAFQTYRAAAQTLCSVPARAQSVELPAVKPLQDQLGDAGAISKSDVSESASPKAVATRTAAAKTVSLKVRRREKAMAAHVRLVANGDAWPLWAMRISPTAEGAGEVIVLSTSQDDRTQSAPEAPIGPVGVDSIAQPACRDPPQVVALPRDIIEPAAGQRRDESADQSLDGIIVSDDLGPQIPIGPAELEVIEAYLGHLLDDLLVSSPANPNSDTG